MNKDIPICSCFLIIVLLAVEGMTAAGDETISNTGKLKRHLLAQYDKYATPIKNASTSIPVFIGIGRMTLVEINEAEQKMVIDLIMSMHWKDEHFQWNPNDYEGIDQLLLMEDELWVPEIVLYNSAPLTNNIPWYNNNNYISVRHNGVIRWGSPSSVSVLCPVLSIKPMEERICNITVASYLYRKHEIDLQLDVKKMRVDDTYRSDTPVWKIMNFSASLKSISTEAIEFPIAVFSIHVKRQYYFVGDVVTGPRTVAILLTLTMFWIPPNSDKKLNLGCLMLLVFAGIILYLSSTVVSPSHLAETVAPLQVTAFTITSALLIEVIILNLARLSDIVKPPPILVRILSGMVGRFIGVCSRLEYKEDGGTVRSPETEEEENLQATITIEEEWALIAMALDRIFFIAYAAIFVIIS